MERRANKAGSFLLCSVRDAGLKKHCIVFPEGKGLVGGWGLLAKKLRILRVEPKVSRIGGSIVSEGRMEKTITHAISRARSFTKVVSTKHSPHGEVVRVKVEDEEVKGRLGLLSRCLVGWWGKETKPRWKVHGVCRRVSSLWESRGSLKVI